MSERLAQLIPNARAVIVPDTRHMLPVEREDAFIHQLEAPPAELEGPTNG